MDARRRLPEARRKQLTGAGDDPEREQVIGGAAQLDMPVTVVVHLEPEQRPVEVTALAQPVGMGDILGKLARISPDFMSEGRGLDIESDRDALCSPGTCSTPTSASIA